MTKDITHKYLRKEISDFALSDNLGNLIIELEHSTLIAPKQDCHEFSILKINDMEFITLFTDLFEYEKFDHADDAFPQSRPFRFYLDYLKNEDIEGFIINSESEHFFIGRDFLEIIDPDHGTTGNSTGAGIQEIRQTMDNGYLKQYLKTNALLNFQELIIILQETHVFTILMSKDDATCFNEESELYVKRTGRSSHVLIFTDENEIPVSSSDECWPGIVNMSWVMKYVLSNDLDGIVLNITSDNVAISRSEIRTYLYCLKCSSTQY